MEACFISAGQATGSTGLLKNFAHGNPLTMQNIDTLFKAAKRRYDNSQPSLAECFEVTRACLEKLNNSATLRHYGEFRGVPNIEYWVAEGNGNLSRPYRPELFISDLADFETAATSFQDQLDDDEITDPVTFERVIYTVVSSFCLCYDVWKPKSRKTPGTFFEVLVGSICYVRYPAPAFQLTKHIPITVEAPVNADAEDDGALQGNSVSTDLVITNSETEKGAVIPLKITTRERIVQPFAHQRILDSAYPERFRSYLTCISEVQRDDNTTSVKQICVPGTVALFQKHLSELSGLYYCDIPQRYARQDFTALIRVTGIANLFDDIDDWLDR